MEAVKLNVKFEYEEETPYLLEQIVFEVTSGNLKVVFETSSPEHVSVEQCRDFVATVKDQTPESSSRAYLYFQCSDGEISLQSVNGETTFTVSRYDSLGRGSCVFTLPNSVCFDAFEKVLDAYEKTPTR